MWNHIGTDGAQYIILTSDIKICTYKNKLKKIQNQQTKNNKIPTNTNKDQHITTDNNHGNQYRHTE